MTNPTETIQAMYGAFGRGDIPSLLAMLSEEVEWTHHGSTGLPFMGSFRGKAGVTQWFGHVAQHEGIEAFEPREFFAGAEHVTVLGWERTRALPGGSVFETPWIHVFEVKGGKVTRFVGMYDTAASAAARA